MNILLIHLRFIWLLMLGGVISGACIGLFFHHSEWLGGYNSFPRRLLRLGHISFFGLAFVNGIFVLTLPWIPFPPLAAQIASTALICGSLLMPICCFLTAYNQRFRVLFPLPTIAVAIAIITVLGFLS